LDNKSRVSRIGDEMVFLGFAVCLSGVGIYLTFFQSKNEMTSKARQKMRVHIATSFWLSFLFFDFFTISRGSLNFLCMLVVFLFLGFNILVTISVNDKDYETEGEDPPIN
jgi:hypothetical protein